MFRKVWGKQLIIALAVALVVVLVAATASFAAPSDNPSDWGWCNGVVVQHGQTLSGIAAYYGVSTWALASYNGIANPNYVRAGQCLMIPAKGSGYYHGNWGYYNNCCSYNYYQPQGHWMWENGCWVYRYY